MARDEIDPIDIVALVLWPIAGGMILGVWSFGIDVFGGYDFTQPLVSGWGVNLSVAFIAAVGSIAWIVGTNELDDSNYDQWEYYMIGGRSPSSRRTS